MQKRVHIIIEKLELGYQCGDEERHLKFGFNTGDEHRVERVAGAFGESLFLGVERVD